MYVEIKENKLLSWCEKPYADYVKVDVDYETFDAAKYSVVEGVLTDISSTDEYKAQLLLKEKSEKLADFTSQIEALDRKRIRAIAEPEVKDTATGQTWLEYYTSQICSLRAQIAAL